jgi:hypothetical protein
MAQFNTRTRLVNPSKSSELVEMVTISDGYGRVITNFGSIPSCERVATLETVTDGGKISAGSKSVTITNIGSLSGILLGSKFISGASITFSAGGTDTIAAIEYDATGTSFLIARLV